MGILDFFSRGEAQRTPEQQQAVDEATSSMALYHYQSCPFCVRVRRALSRLGLEVELRDIQMSPQHLSDLVSGGGSRQVPCLRIEEEGEAGESSIRWLYESGDIIRYLENRFS